MQSTLFLNTREPTEGFNLDHCLELNETCGINIEYARKTLIPQDCNKIIDKVYFLGRQKPCEEIFKLFQTEQGTCFIANSIYSSKKLNAFNIDFSQLPLTYKNTDNVDRILEIHSKHNNFLSYKFSVHSPEEMPDTQSTYQVVRKPGLLNYVALKTVEFVNEIEVPNERRAFRKCRYPYEKLSNFSLPYCKANCLFIKRIEGELAECNCTLPAGLNVSSSVSKCTMKSIRCIAKVAKDLEDSMKDKKKSQQIKKDCLVPTCTYMEIKKIGDYEEPINGLNHDISVIRIEVLNKPTLRYVRRIQFTNLDIIGKII